MGSDSYLTRGGTMIRRMTALAALGMIMITAGFARADDKDKLQGYWKAEKQVRGGKDSPAEEVEKLVLKFEGNKAFPEEKPNDVAEFTLDATKKPKAIDIKTPKGDTILGIYELDGDNLKLCFNRE